MRYLSLISAAQRRSTDLKKEKSLKDSQTDLWCLLLSTTIETQTSLLQNQEQWSLRRTAHALLWWWSMITPSTCKLQNNSWKLALVTRQIKLLVERKLSRKFKKGSWMIAANTIDWSSWTLTCQALMGLWLREKLRTICFDLKKQELLHAPHKIQRIWRKSWRIHWWMGILRNQYPYQDLKKNT